VPIVCLALWPLIWCSGQLRREYRMTGQEVAERLQLQRSTMAGHLTRLGRFAALEPSEPARRDNRARAGEPVHLTPEGTSHRQIGSMLRGTRNSSSRPPATMCSRRRT
jgi:hypothetical protein